MIDPDERDKLTRKIKSYLKRIDGLDTRDAGYFYADDKARTLSSFTIPDPKPRYQWHDSNSFHLQLDDENRLTIKSAGYRSDAMRLVSDLDEIGQFIEHCKRQLDIRAARKSKREKILQLKSQAILAQVKSLAKEEQFDFMSESDSHKLTLYVKLSDQQAVALHVPFGQFREVLPQLRDAIRSLRQLFDGGIRFKMGESQR